MILTTTLLIVIVTVVVCGGSTLSLLTWLGIPIGVGGSGAADDEEEAAPIASPDQPRSPERQRYDTVRVAMPARPSSSTSSEQQACLLSFAPSAS